MKILRSLAISFSTYSKLPVPHFEWKKEDMQYVLLFFPWVGAALALIEAVWYFLCDQILHFSSFAYVLTATGLVILITGGFHLDGYMDTMDAIHSYKPAEEKRQILKDSHIGAFAVIMLVLYFLFYVAFLYELSQSAEESQQYIVLWLAGFVISRALSGLCALAFPKYGEKGSLKFMSDASSDKVVSVGLTIELIVTCLFILFCDFHAGMAVIVASGIWVYVYKYITDKQFEGTSGDTAGYFLCMCELIYLIVLVVFIHSKV